VCVRVSLSGCVCMHNELIYKVSSSVLLSVYPNVCVFLRVSVCLGVSRCLRACVSSKGAIKKKDVFGDSIENREGKRVCSRGYPK